MYNPFFPSTAFAWGFLILLGVVLAVAAYIDWRRTVIPKWLTLGLLGLGVLVNIIRGAWLGVQGEKLWFFPTDNIFLGALDGLLFALIGCVCGFFMLFVLWILGTCGGGDVKLFAGLSAWLGPVYTIFVLAGSLIVLFVEGVIKAITSGGLKALKPAPKSQKKPKPGSWRLTYSLPVAIATVAVMMWFFRVDLGLAKPRPAPDNVKVQNVR